MKVPTLVMLFIACCVTLPRAIGINVPNSIRQFSFAFVTAFVSIVILCGLCDHLLIRKKGQEVH